MSKTITTSQILKEFKISRATFYNEYKDFVIEIPSKGNKCVYDYESVKKRHDSRKKKYEYATN